MADRFTDRVAVLAGQTTRTLLQMAKELEESGLSSQAATLRNISNLHAQIANDCLIETQPIELERYRLVDRLAKCIEDVQQVSADLMARRKPGHGEASDAADILEHVLAQQDR